MYYRMQSYLSLCVVIVLSCLAISASALTHGAPRVQYETQLSSDTHSDSNPWHQMGSAATTDTISLLFAIKLAPAQIHLLQETATLVSTPGSPLFRQYLSLDEVNQRFAPPIDNQLTVIHWINEALGLNKSNTSITSVNRSVDIKPTLDLLGIPPVRSVSKAIVKVPAVGWVRVESITVADAAKLLHTEFQLYKYKPSVTTFPSILPIARTSQLPNNPFATSDSPSETDWVRDAIGVDPHEPIIRAIAGYSLPVDIAACVDFVGGVTKFPSLRGKALSLSHRSRAAETSFSPSSIIIDNRLTESRERDATTLDASYTVTPALLRQQYNISLEVKGSDSLHMRQVVPQFLEQYFSDRDLQLFLLHNNIAWNNVSKVIGPNFPHNAGGEASLDIQLIMGLAPGVRTELWSFAGRRDNTQQPSDFNQEPFLDWIVQLSADSNPPLVHSVSYADDEKDCTAAYMRRLNIEFQKAAVRGMSIIFAAGDDGIFSVDGRTNQICNKHNPTFPSSAPWITSVGGTQLAPVALHDLRPLSQATRPEIACSSRTGCMITTGGGMSEEFSRPEYQAEVVSRYLSKMNKPNKRLPPSSWFNANGRGYPDIAALATNYEIFVNGRSVRIGGTSASAPVIAAMVSLWNEKLMAQGLPALGFINPWLYQLAKDNPTFFFDITEGDNACGQASKTCCAYGFPAAQQWDAATGIGTPNFQRIYDSL